MRDPIANHANEEDLPLLEDVVNENFPTDSELPELHHVPTVDLRYLDNLAEDIKRDITARVETLFSQALQHALTQVTPQLDNYVRTRLSEVVVCATSPDPHAWSKAEAPPSTSPPTPPSEPESTPTNTMDKTYNPHALEERWYQTWEEQGYFAPRAEGRPYCIMIPPPNVTGTLHMGHAFQATLMDTLIRYHRMRGDNTLWQAGTDHAGIATQMVVERQLAAQGQSRHDLGREEFIAKVWEWKAHSGGHITRQLRRLGASLDWNRERFTMDAGLSQAVTEVFVRLYEENLIYRGKRLVNWDPVLHTAVSDLEVVPQEEDGYLWHIRYPLSNDNGYVVVATTRPETMLGDVAVAVHPADERYNALIGQEIELPLTGRRIPIIADEYVDPAFGSGCVKITPAHDFNDYAIGQRHDLRAINIFTPDAKIISDRDTATLGQESASDLGIPKPYQGLDRFEARQRLVADLEAQGLIEDIKPHKLMVPRGDRTHAVIEPLLTDQWFVKTKPLAEPAIHAVASGAIKFIPENWARTYYDWMYKIEDWCISRQIWWGHRIPAWYDEDGTIYVARSEADVREKYGLPPDIVLRQDNDVLDTWFSSALWPFSTLGWPEQTPALKTYYPTAVLVTGFDIIFFWVARMVMMGLKFTGEVPFREVYIHGLVRDSEGQKMSKSKGNVLDPIDLIDGIDLPALITKRTSGLLQPAAAPLIEKATLKQFPNGIPAFGTDALRYTFCALASTGRDIKFDLNRIEGYRNFCNKLWNAARYVLMNTEGLDCGQGDAEIELSLADRWILARLNATIVTVTHHLDTYRFDLAAQALYEFTWNEYCDWYVELSKPVLTAPAQRNAAELRGTRFTLVGVLEALLRLMHPVMPFLTEEIWQRVAPLAGKSGTTIMTQSYPVSSPAAHDPAALSEMEWVMGFIVGVRQIRSSMNISPGKPLPVLLQHANRGDEIRLEENRHYLSALARLESIRILPHHEVAPESASALLGDMKILIPMAGLIDKQAEIARLNKELEKLSKELEKCQAKLGNPNYVERAPVEVVAKERARADELQVALHALAQQRDKIALL